MSSRALSCLLDPHAPMAPLPLYPERRAFAPSPLGSVSCRPEFMLILLGALYLYCILFYSLCSLSCISVFSSSANIKFFLSSHPSPFQTFNGYNFPSSSPSPLSPKTPRAGTGSEYPYPRGGLWISGRKKSSKPATVASQCQECTWWRGIRVSCKMRALT